ncbi:MAG: tryptophan-rich sensory protein, partial [Verrucomicrobia bacterium]|nr:tryptophan-rich sensory protein [Cytophagales bacterium]
MNTQVLTSRPAISESVPIRTLQVLNVVFFSLTIFVNYLANGLPLNGKTTGELSQQYPNLFTPAGFTFAIWGLIYTLLIIFCIYQARSLFNRTRDVSVETVVRKIGVLFILTCVLNMAWILAWHYEYTALSVVLMLAFLGVLIRLNLNLGVSFTSISRQEKYLAHIPFGIYFGWITVATIANITAFLVDYRWDGFGFPAEFWAVAMLLIGTLVTLFVVIKTNNIFYGLTVIWGFVGIIAKRYALIETEPFQSVPY